MENTSIDKERIFNSLHHNNKILVLPNIWDPLGALLLEKLGYAAVATSSSAMSLSNGYPDGEKMPFDELLCILKSIVDSVKIPVTADVESMYSTNDDELRDNTKKLIDTGIVGINFEDSLHNEPGMIPIDEQCKKIALIKKTAQENGSQLFINARVDVYIKAAHLSEEEKLKEAILRGRAYKDAGADALYPIVLKDKDAIKAFVDETGLPVNIIMLPGIPDFDTMKSIGIARLSMASGFLKTAITSMKNIAEKLLEYQGLEEATKNLITSDYLGGLVPDEPIKKN